MKEGQTEHGYTSTIKLLFPEVFLTINDQEYSHSLDMVSLVKRILKDEGFQQALENNE